MTTEPELDKLIIENIADLDAAAKRADVLVAEIWMEVIERLQSWATDQGWWASQDPADPSVAPPDWVDGDQFFAWFNVDWGPRDTGVGEEGQAYFDLSRFAGVGEGKLCLWLNFDEVKRSAWKPLFRDAAGKAEVGSFSFDSTDGFYIDCTPPAGALSMAVAEEDFVAAFEPLTRALDAAHEHWRFFDSLLRKARA